MTTPRPRHPLLLVVIDGWGHAAAGPHNAIHLAGAPTMARLAREFPSTLLEASGSAVGLPPGQMGNSEVGHLNIGAGRVVDQDFVKITRVCREGTIGDRPAIKDAFRAAKTAGGTLHLVGLLGPGGVHSHEEHLFGLLRAAHKAKVPRTMVHHILDGRDTSPKSAVEFSRRAQTHIDAAGARVATVAGRFYAMDRDKRWDRTGLAYRALAKLEGEKAETTEQAVESAYARGETDEFVRPTVLPGAAPVRHGDGVIVYNFRPDRVRQLVRALADPAFQEFSVQRPGPNVVGMTQYDATFASFGVQTAFPPNHPTNTLGELYATLGLRQLRIAETEKYAHVTYFFSGGRETPFAREERLLVPSPRVTTYDLAPEMSARELTDKLVARVAVGHELIVLNFANADMVAHTGRLGPTVEACRVVDDCIRRLVDAYGQAGYLVAITADHGNAETMLDAEGRVQTAHSTNPVPFILVHPALKGGRLRPGGGLSSVAPTVLDILGVPTPPEMTAPSLWQSGPGTKPTPA